jgi:hypothetical protein
LITDAPYSILIYNQIYGIFGLEHFANEIAQCSGGGYPPPAPQA